ncbi:MAG: nucleotidyltransferase [Bdellovibrionales bacterium]|nr:nucleotidyltransferase [Bdellovibrionales bacterium]
MIGLCGRHKDSEGQSSSLDTEAGRKFDVALFTALDALEESQVSYALIGGIAATGLGRPRSTQDIDLFVRPEDAEAILEILGRHGFRTEQTNPTWLFKAFKDGVLVDIIFRSEGGFYFDDEMRERTRMINYHGRQVRTVSPEDFILIKCAVHSEEGPHHWHDALSVLSHSQVDWNYLLHRSRKAARRLLALLVYAQSDDIWVPNSSIQSLFQNVFGPPSDHAPRPAESQRPPAAPAEIASEPYLAAQIREAFEQSERVGALGVDVWVSGKSVLVRGEIQTEEQHASIMELVREKAPAHEINDQLRVMEWQGPREFKDIV